MNFSTNSLQIYYSISRAKFNFSDTLIDIAQFVANIPDLSFSVLSLGQDVVVAFVLFELERLDDE